MSDVKNMRQNSEKQKLQSAMGEVCVLKENDLQRQDLEQKIAHLDWAKQEWEMLICEQDVLQDNLADIKIPIDLQKKLLQIPQKKSTTSSRRYLQLAIAASIAFILVWFWPTQSLSLTIKDLVLSSATWHLQPIYLEVETNNRDKLREYFITKTNMSPAWKKVDERFSLRGGSVIKVNNKSVLCSSWNTSAGQCMLVQFKAKDFSFSDKLKKQIWDDKHPQHGKNLAQMNRLCIVWIKDGFAHIWVIKDSPEARTLFSL